MAVAPPSQATRSSINGVQNGSVGNGVTASWNAATSTLTLTGSASIAVYDALLSAVTYQDTGTDARPEVTLSAP